MMMKEMFKDMKMTVAIEFAGKIADQRGARRRLARTLIRNGFQQRTAGEPGEVWRTW